MKKTLKITAQVILTITFFVCLVLLFSERPDGSASWYNLIGLAGCLGCGCGLNALGTFRNKEI